MVEGSRRCGCFGPPWTEVSNGISTEFEAATPRTRRTRTTVSMATSKFTLLGPSFSPATNFTSRPSRPTIRSNLSFYSNTPKVIRLWAKHLRKVGVIVLCGNGGGGGGSSGGDGDGEAEEEEQRFEEKPMLGSPKDQEDERFKEKPMLGSPSSGLGETMLQLYGFEFDDDIFWMKNAAEYQKYEEKMLKELEIAADLAKASRVGNFRLFYLPGGPVSLSPPIEFIAGSIAESMYACPYKELQAKAMVANFRLFDHPGHVSLSPSIEVNAGSTTAILYAYPDKELQADVDGDGALKFVFVSFHPGKLANDELLKKAFAVFDLNKSGHIGLEEVINATALIV